ncbi:MAG: hypothetical protein HQL81_11350 [Magnetococcales bacterium]|nr:hypothetical protein [Magnetococcales bacterium]
MRIYSPFLKTLHDEIAPVGQLGRGTHCSILRAVVWHDAQGRALSTARFHDFAIIWDEDHDERVIAVVEELYFRGILPSIQFIGERKALITLVSHETLVPNSRKPLFEQALETATERISDVWDPLYCSFPNDAHQIVSDAKERVDLYLASIHMLWSLGTKDIVLDSPFPQPMP